MIFYVVLSIFFLCIYFFGKHLRQRYFAYVMSVFPLAFDPTYIEMKANLLKPIHDIVSHNPRLKKNKSISILEVGVGAGVNFEFYPDGTNLIAIDPNPYFKSYYDKNREKFSNIKSEEIILTTGEEMDMIESNSVDVVVMTLVMCSVQDINKILRQIHRVLTPGGKFFFLEHIMEFDGKKHWIRRTLQKFFSVTGIWSTIFDGCCLNRDQLANIQATGFSDVDGKRIYAPIDHWFFSIISPHLLGVATK